MRVIAGTARGVTLKTPNGMDTRPTADRVKEAVFSILHFDLPGAAVLDLFGGTGQLGIEAISRGAVSCDFVDESEAACKIIRENLKRTKFEEKGTVVRSDYKAFLLRCRKKYDIILLDPPYAKDFLENSLKSISEIDILQTGGIIVTERPLEKELLLEFAGYTRSKDYKYGNTLITLYRKNAEQKDG